MRNALSSDDNPSADDDKVDELPDKMPLRLAGMAVAEGESISLNTETTVSIDVRGEVKLFEFTPAETGLYRFYSTNAELRQLMVSIHVSCIIHQMMSCTANSVYPISEHTTDATNTISDM